MPAETSGFIELTKTVGIAVSICILVMVAAWRLIQRQMDQNNADRAAEREERQKSADAHQALVQRMSEDHAAAMRDMSQSVAKMADAVTANTMAVQHCQKQ